ncbi:hypothetical protein CONCODRAFT_3585 [Conidiobolus coronatus NRRL 28638]|uniref:Uncharacterized protein n=1 Tax=Conidiobolus coronatus (strain ATCC 28846 / CBS 209.66 / NRRL 28638) TaxID=796925 RepID=A0A137PER6_CONC2|nr:hypothetical protein CONCODRAFT_3585 [Conidiobolus coronatus NRRL 28638]|eukprot:KXN73483.1 hypothetical protein CONCODRAFT_3585 [Conidiobolus coronatus NRRL 28638]
MSQIKKNKCLVLSDNHSLSFKLIQKLQILSKTQEPIQDSLLENENSTFITKLNLNNKYYSFNLDVWSDTITEDVNQELLNNYQELFEFIDGLIFVFDKNSIESFNKIKAWIPLIQAKKPSILIGCSLNLTSSNEQVNTDEFFDWFIENEFEYFDIESMEDEESFNELYTSLQSHTWDGIEMVNKAKSTPNTLGRDLLDDYDQELPSKEEIENLRQTLFSKPANSDPNEEDIMGFDMGQAVDKIQNLREQAKNMSMDQRRHLAATLALSIGLEMDQVSDFEDL